MKILNIPKIYTSYYGFPTESNPLYREPLKPEKIERERKVEPVKKGRSIDLRV